MAGTLSTRHLKNTDFATGPQGISPTFEVCTNDMAQAIDWSESQATWHGQYSDLVEVRSDSHMFEVVRVPRADVTAMMRHRVFRCDYLDRTNTDLRTDTGAAGSMNQRPLTADELEELGRVPLAVHDVQQLGLRGGEQLGATGGGSLVQTIRMGQLVRGAAGACDTVQIVDWTHTMRRRWRDHARTFECAYVQGEEYGRVHRAVCAVTKMGRRNPASLSSPDSLEQLAACADLQSDPLNLADIDWHSADFDHFAEQTLGGNRSL